MCSVLIAFGWILSSGCVTTESSREYTRDLENRVEVESQLKTEEDWQRWRKMQEHNENATIIIDDR